MFVVDRLWHALEYVALSLDSLPPGPSRDACTDVFIRPCTPDRLQHKVAVETRNKFSEPHSQTAAWMLYGCIYGGPYPKQRVLGLPRVEMEVDVERFHIHT